MDSSHGWMLAGYVHVRYHTYTMATRTKLTITVDREIIPRAKRYARARGVSLSSLIEEALRTMTEPERPSFARTWRGRFEAAERDEERYRALMQKYR